MTEPAIRYDATTDTLLVELRAWPPPTQEDDPSAIGGEDAGVDLVIHYAADGRPFAYEIQNACEHPEHVTAALRARRAEAQPPRQAA